MIRSELVARIAELNPHLYAKDVEAAVNAILARMMAALAVGGRIELRDFGSFVLIPREAREGCNPRTGAKVDVPEKAKVRFRPAKEMKERLMAAPSRPAARAKLPSAHSWPLDCSAHCKRYETPFALIQRGERMSPSSVMIQGCASSASRA